MFKVVTPSECLLFTTLRIETRKGGKPHGFGTGFFYHFTAGEEKDDFVVVVTNKHVIEGADEGSFFVHEPHETDYKQPSGKFFKVKITDFQDVWIDHPDDTIDLCAMPFRAIEILSNRAGKKIYWQLLRDSNIYSESDLEGLSAVEDVLMVGYPIGLLDTKHNLPILRKGTTATHPSIDFQGKPNMLVDMACWPGSSGSPVVILDEGLYLKKGEGLKSGDRLVFLGVLSAGPVHTETGEIVVEPIPAQTKVSVLTNMPINIGYVIKAKEMSGIEAAVLERHRSLKDDNA